MDLKEVKSLSDEVELAVITFIYPEHEQFLVAKTKLQNFIDDYVF